MPPKNPTEALFPQAGKLGVFREDPLRSQNSMTSTPAQGSGPRGTVEEIGLASEPGAPLGVNPNVQFKPSKNAARSALRETGSEALNMGSAGLAGGLQAAETLGSELVGEQGFGAMNRSVDASRRNEELAIIVGAMVKSGHMPVQQAIDLMENLPKADAAEDFSLKSAFALGAQMGSSAAPIASFVDSLVQLSAQQAAARMAAQKAGANKTPGKMPPHSEYRDYVPGEEAFDGKPLGRVADRVEELQSRGFTKAQINKLLEDEASREASGVIDTTSKGGAKFELGSGPNRGPGAAGANSPEVIDPDDMEKVVSLLSKQERTAFAPYEKTAKLFESNGNYTMAHQIRVEGLGHLKATIKDAVSATTQLKPSDLPDVAKLEGEGLSEMDFPFSKAKGELGMGISRARITLEETAGIGTENKKYVEGFEKLLKAAENQPKSTLAKVLAKEGATKAQIVKALSRSGLGKDLEERFAEFWVGAMK